MKTYYIYTDGAVSNNGKKDAIGGWAFLIVDENNNQIYSETGKVIGATNQQMELMAISRACTYAHTFLNVDKICFYIFSDSAYAINCYEQNWWRAWKDNGWRNTKREPVANKELWEQLIPFFTKESFIFKKIKSHSGDDTINSKWNNYVDKLAVEAKTK